MSYNPEFDPFVARPRSDLLTEAGRDGLEAQPPEPQTPLPVGPIAPVEPAPQYVAPQYAPAAPMVFAELPAPARKKRSTGWILPVVVALIGLIASGSLGYLLYTTTNQRELALQNVAATQASLDKLQSQFNAQQADAASHKVVADYVFMVERNDTRVRLDYHTLGACKSFGACRIAVQNLYTDLQAWQSERSLAKTSPALVASDKMLGDGLSAAIAGARQFISGMDTYNIKLVIAGSKKVDAAMFSITKAESAIASVTQQTP